jgi:hypothetical protein
MSRIKNIILLLFLVTHLAVKGQEVTVTAAFDTTSILIGDQINFSVMVDQPAGLELSLPFFKDSLKRNLEILSGPEIDTAEISENKIRITEKYLVTSFDSGLYQIDPVYAEINDSSGIKRYYSEYSVLKVARVQLTPPDTVTNIFDIVGPYRAPVTLGEIMPWVIVAMLAMAFAWLLIRFVNKHKGKKKEVTEPVNIEPAHVLAFRELEKLRDEQLWQNGETKKYYTRLTAIIRQYLENRFRVFSLELTTSETLQALVKTGFKKGEPYNKLKSVLTGADLVKFAKYRPEPYENDVCFTDSWNFVAATKAPEEYDEKSDTTEEQ